MKTKNTKKEEMFLELTGDINIVTRKNGKITNREKIDGKLVLEMILVILEQELDKRDAQRI